MKSPFTRLLDGEPVAPPFPLDSTDDIAVLVDWMSEIHHGPDGRGPESHGAAIALEILAHALQDDGDANRLVGRVRAAIAHEEPAERRAPSASAALEAIQAIDHLSGLDDTGPTETYLRVAAGLLPTPIHARYALSILIEGLATTGGSRHQHATFDLVAQHLAEHPESGETDRQYIERLRSRLEKEITP